MYVEEYKCNMCGTSIIFPGTCGWCEKELHDESLEAAYEYAESCGGTVDVRNGRVTVIVPPVREEPQCYICRCPTDKNDEICDFCISNDKSEDDSITFDDLPDKLKILILSMPAKEQNAWCKSLGIKIDADAEF